MDLLETESWSKVDNVAKIFLATHGDRDTRTLRVCCTLTEPVDPEVLTKALKSTIKSRKLFQVRIRRGLFWHFLEPTKEMPVILKEHERPCPVLYGDNNKGKLHYSVTYYHNRINVEIFHALTDGTGAIEFMNSLVAKYLRLKYPKEMEGVVLNSGGSETDLSEDSYSHFYEKNTKAADVVKDLGNYIKKQEEKTYGRKAYHIRGGKLPYNQLQFFEITLKSSEVIAQAKAMGVGVSGLIGARLMLAIYKDMPASKRKLPISISLPVNLRNYYPSETSRNFFNSITVSHKFTGDETEEDLAKEFGEKMKESLKPEQIKKQMNNYQKFERWFIVRMIPLAIKQPALRLISQFSAKNVSAVISNLGVMKLPEQMQPYVENYSALCSHSELFMTVCSYGDNMTFGITSCYKSTATIKNFLRSFTKHGAEAVINATEVTRI